MEVLSYLRISDENTLKIILKDLNEDPERLERQVCLFKEWLKCEQHLPANIDDHFIRNFVRFCKCNLDKAKRKFENYLVARIKWREEICTDRVLEEKYFETNKIHRDVALHPKLTPEGYRVFFYRLPPIERFDFEQTQHYGITLIDVTLFENVSSGFVVVYDLENFASQHIAKINLKRLLAWIDMVYNISPMRIKSIHILNLPKVAETIFNLAVKLLSEKLSERVIIHKDVKELSKCLPIDILPDEYGGSGGDLDKYADQMKEFLMHNEAFFKKSAALKLEGPIPSDKMNIYSFDEYGMEGSFRKLNID